MALGLELASLAQVDRARPARRAARRPESSVPGVEPADMDPRPGMALAGRVADHRLERPGVERHRDARDQRWREHAGRADRVAAAAEQPQRRAVGVEHALAVQVDREQRLRRLVEREAIALLAEPQLALDRSALAPRRLLAQRALDRGHEPQRPVLGDEVERAGVDRRHRLLLVRRARDDDARQIVATHELERLQAAEPRHDPVGDHQVPRRRERRDEVARGGDALRRDRVATAAQLA